MSTTLPTEIISTQEDNDIKYEIIDSDAPSVPSNTLQTDIRDDILSEEKIKSFVQEHKPKLFILTPCYGGMCYINYMICLIQTIDLCRRHNILVQVEFCRNDSLVPRARNNLIAKAMTDKDMTHVIFIDNDISWEPMEVIKLLLHNKNVVGGIYPLKRYMWNNILQDGKNPYNTNVVQSIIDRKTSSHLKSILPDEMMVRANLVKYNVNYLSETLEIRSNLAKVRHIATGFMMIKRDTFSKMFKEYSNTKYVDDVNFLLEPENENAYALFDCRVEEGHYFSEDWLFCKRWIDIGGEVFADVTVNLTHTGQEDYFGCYIGSIL